jgi:hypothetical protein
VTEVPLGVDADAGVIVTLAGPPAAAGEKPRAPKLKMPGGAVPLSELAATVGSANAPHANADAMTSAASRLSTRRDNRPAPGRASVRRG